MYSELGLGLGALVFLIWMGVLTFFVIRGREFLNTLFPKSGERDIRKKFEEILQTVTKSEKDLKGFEKRFENLEKDGLEHIQKYGLVRFNPFDDTGGDQSFSISLLDNYGTGMVITSMHGRSGTRVFAKSVVKGKSEKYQFSKEEEEAVEKALEK